LYIFILSGCGFIYSKDLMMVMMMIMMNYIERPNQFAAGTRRLSMELLLGGQ